MSEPTSIFEVSMMDRQLPKHCLVLINFFLRSTLSGCKMNVCYVFYVVSASDGGIGLAFRSRFENRPFYWAPLKTPRGKSSTRVTPVLISCSSSTFAHYQCSRQATRTLKLSTGTSPTILVMKPGRKEGCGHTYNRIFA